MSRKSKIKIIAAGAIIATCLVGVMVMTRAEDTVAHPTAETTDPTVDPTVTPTATPTPTPVPTYAPIRPVKVTPPKEMKNDNEPDNNGSTDINIASTESAAGPDSNDGGGISTSEAESDEGTDGDAEDNSGEPENIEYNPGTDEGNNQEQTIEEEPVVEEEITEEAVEYSEPEVTETVSEDTGDGWEYYCNARITFYCTESCCCGANADGITASERPATPYWTVANGSLPFGTHVLIDGQEYCVEDRGVGGDQFDVLVGSHDEALARGMYYTEVYVKW